MRTSVLLDDELSSYVDEVSSSVGENNAEAIGEAIRHAREQDACVDRLESRVDELQTMLDDRDARIDELKQDIERLQNEKQMILAQRDEHQKLVRYVEDERTDARRWRQAGPGTKLKCQLFGIPDDTDDETD